MSVMKVDVEKCSRDGICIEICPLRLLSADGEGRPQMRPGAAAHCIGCGHCVAVCPRGALDNAKNPLCDQGAIPDKYVPDVGQSLLFLRSRRSIRRYKKEAVPREKVVELLEIARFAPSGHNTQGISYLVVDSAANLSQLRELIAGWMKEAVESSPELSAYLNLPALIEAHERGEDLVLRDAPVLIVAHAPAALLPAQISTALALEYVELFAPSLGLGTCWAGIAQRCAQAAPAFSRFLAIPEDRKITGMLMAGYPKYNHRRLPTRNPLDVAWFSE
ncbi:MAG: nitroreductase family protein [Syntrophobacteraceae bacterium]|nr:nitroreductase family protein [Syntrophobacteraceae bacterium]